MPQVSSERFTTIWLMCSMGKNPEKVIEILENILNKELHPNQVFFKLSHRWDTAGRL